MGHAHSGWHSGSEPTNAAEAVQDHLDALKSALVRPIAMDYRTGWLVVGPAQHNQTLLSLLK